MSLCDATRGMKLFLTFLDRVMTHWKGQNVVHWDVVNEVGFASCLWAYRMALTWLCGGPAL